jgi:hypothetical protein
MNFTITTTEDKENNTTDISVIFSNGKTIKTQIQNWKNDVDTRGSIARAVFNIVKEEMEASLSEIIEEKGYKIKHGGRPRFTEKEKSEEQRERDRKKSLAYYYRKKAQNSVRTA